MPDTPEFPDAVKALQTVISHARLARRKAANLHAVLGHAMVEIALRQEGLNPGHPAREERRAELWKLNASGLLRLSIGGGVAEVETLSNS
jgi:hypothetical protein